MACRRCRRAERLPRRDQFQRRVLQRSVWNVCARDVSELSLDAYLASVPDSAVTVDALSDADEAETPKTKSRTRGRRKGRAPPSVPLTLMPTKRVTPHEQHLHH